MQESKLERQMKREVEKMGGKALKWVSPGLSGVPDRIVLFPGGKIYFVEMKAPGKKLRPLQEKRTRDLKAFGFSVYVIDSQETLDQFIREVTE